MRRLLTLGLLAEDPSQPGGYRLIEPLTLEPEFVDGAKARAMAKHLEAFASWLVTEARDPEQAEHDPRTHSAQALVTRDPATVAAFLHNFERDWAQARPLTLLSADRGSPIQEAIIAALKTGADHEAIAKQLNITSRTVTKHAATHRTALGAAPGFQHGYLTAWNELTQQANSRTPEAEPGAADLVGAGAEASSALEK